MSFAYYTDRLDLIIHLNSDQIFTLPRFIYILVRNKYFNGYLYMPADISFASFNLYNFQKAGSKTYSSTPVSQSKYDAKKKWTREMLLKMDADVIAFQELWDKDCLDDVINTPELSDYQAVYIKPSWYKIAIAMIVRSPWEVSGSIEVIKDFPFKELIKIDTGDGDDDEVSVNINRFSRSIMKVTLKHADSQSTPEITVFACHLKSKLPSYSSQVPAAYNAAIGASISTIRRTAEAAALRILLIDHMKGSETPTVVIGDLNDGPESNTLNIITDQPTMSKNARGGDKSLYSAVQLQQLQSFNNVYYTHEYKHHKGVLDHILVSEEFFDYSNDSIWSHKDTRIWNDHIGDSDVITSDHGIIKASFK